VTGPAESAQWRVSDFTGLLPYASSLKVRKMKRKRQLKIGGLPLSAYNRIRIPHNKSKPLQDYGGNEWTKAKYKQQVLVIRKRREDGIKIVIVFPFVTPATPSKFFFHPPHPPY
jgi:hypothetical protein